MATGKRGITMRALLLVVGLLWAIEASAAGNAGQFDYYLLNLSWSPSFCAAKGDKADQAQCGVGQRRDFVVHGLWPQYAAGGWPESCSTARVPDRTIESMLDLMPARGLVIHEWKKHGTCSGLEPDAYFTRLRQAYDKIRIPPSFKAPATPRTLTPAAIVGEFTAANPGLPDGAIALRCTRGRLAEVSICFDRDAHAPATCGKLKPACKDQQVTILPAR